MAKKTRIYEFAQTPLGSLRVKKPAERSFFKVIALDNGVRVSPSYSRETRLFTILTNKCFLLTSCKWRLFPIDLGLMDQWRVINNILVPWLVHQKVYWSYKYRNKEVEHVCNPVLRQRRETIMEWVTIKFVQIESLFLLAVILYAPRTCQYKFVR